MKSFLETVCYEEKKAECRCDIHKGQNPFITISRPAGAGGHSLAGALLTEIHRQKSAEFQAWQMCDQEICKMLCNEPGLSLVVQNWLNKEYHSQIEDILEELIVGTSPQDKVIKRMFVILRRLASFGKVILVDHGANFVTQGMPLGIHIRLVASLESRIRRMMQVANLNEKNAKQFITEQDKSREALVRNFFNKDIKDPLNYDVVWNTDGVSISEIAKRTVEMMKQKACCTSRE
ncbi:MAG: cytidylate kinase-like family protein [Candidatus Omnitrophica bacterium]|nr:cytidylate kinase-like family protein [Candidatus Omnitrophota bacterium]